MATSKPQGKNDGKFVDPLDKWEESLPDFTTTADEAKKQTDNNTKKKAKDGKKGPLSKEELTNMLINAPDKAAEQIANLMKQVANPSLSRSDRVALQRELANSRRAFKEVTDASNNVAKELKESRRLEAQAYAKLNRLKTWRAQNGNEAGFTKDDLQSIRDTEDSLKEFIKASEIFRKGDNSKDEDVKKFMVNKLDELLDRVGSMPDEFQERFKQDNNKLDEIIKRQSEAKKFVKNQNDAIKKALMKTADKIGFGAFNLGNAARGASAIWNAPKNIKNKYNETKQRTNKAFDYVKQTVQMRQLAKTNVVEGEGLSGDLSKDTKTALDKDNLQQAKKQTSTMQKYVASSDRFRARLLDKLGRKKKEQPKDDSSFLEGFSDLFGKGGFLKTLLKVAAGVSGVAIAGAVGYWIGSKIWEKIAPEMAKKFNNISGLDEAGRNATRAINLNTQENFNRAKTIDTELQKPGSKVSRADQDWYADFKQDNQKVDLSKAYAPSPAMQSINAKSAGAVSTPSPSSSASGGGSAEQAIDAMKGSQATSVVPVSGGSLPVSGTSATNNGSLMAEDWVGKTIKKQDGSVDVKGLNGNMQANLVNMSKEYFEKTGKQMQINSGFRSNEKQAQLFKTLPKGMASAPGRSLHNFGVAVDINSANANELHNLGLLDKYGFTRPIPSEKWHVEPAGVSIAAAKAGVYSADAPKNQGGGADVSMASSAAAAPQAQTVAMAEPRVGTAPAQAQSSGGQGGGRGGTIGSGKKSAADIPTFDTRDGHLLAMNMGVV